MNKKKQIKEANPFIIWCYKCIRLFDMNIKWSNSITNRMNIWVNGLLFFVICFINRKEEYLMYHIIWTIKNAICEVFDLIFVWMDLSICVCTYMRIKWRLLLIPFIIYRIDSLILAKFAQIERLYETPSRANYSFCT